MSGIQPGGNNPSGGPTPPRPTARIRNVILLGHSGTGKTALAEALAGVAGTATPTRGGVLDFDPEERDRGHSLGLSMLTIPWDGHTLNVLDAPGGPETFGDAFPALRAADLAIFVVDASSGIQPQHDQLWEACAAIGLPRAVVLNKLDKPNASYQRHIDALRERCGKRLAPVHMPIGVGHEFTGIIDLLHASAVTLDNGRRVESEVPDNRREQAERNREFLVEAIVETDDELLLRYLDGDVPNTKELAAGFAQGIATGRFFPVLCASAELVIGVRRLADFLVEEGPAPQGDPDAPCVAYVAKTLSDPYVGRINVLRVHAGQLAADDHLTVARTGADVRLHQLFTLCGNQQTPTDAVPCGGMAAVAKLDDVRTGDVLCAKAALGVALLGANSGAASLEMPRPPVPYYRVALEPVTAGDEDKLSTGLARIREEDPSLLVERDPATHQVVLRAYGPGHVDVILARLERKFGVSVMVKPVRIGYHETLRSAATGLGRHVKQSGGHGQFGVATIEVEPLPRGSGFVFEDGIVGGVIPGTYIPSVEKGVVEAMARGVLAGYPVVDVRVRLVDGKQHAVDSSDMAFRMAGSLAFRDAAAQAGVVLLEPVMDVEVVVPDDLTGEVMGDLSARRGRIQGTEQARPGLAGVRALVPAAELRTYVAELRSLSRGAGTVTIAYDHHDEVPDHIARAVVAENRRG